MDYPITPISPEVEVVCVGDINLSLMFWVLMSALGFLLIKSLGFEGYIRRGTKQDFDMGIPYAVGLVLAMFSLWILSIFAVA